MLENTDNAGTLDRLSITKSPKHRIIKAIYICVYSGVYWPLMSNYCSLLYGICLIALFLYFSVYLWTLWAFLGSLVVFGVFSYTSELLGIFQVFLMFLGYIFIFWIFQQICGLFKSFMVFQLFYRDFFWYVFIRLFVFIHYSWDFGTVLLFLFV